MRGVEIQIKVLIDEIKTDAAFERHDSGQICAGGGHLRPMGQEVATNM